MSFEFDPVPIRHRSSSVAEAEADNERKTDAIAKWVLGLCGEKFNHDVPLTPAELDAFFDSLTTGSRLCMIIPFVSPSQSVMNPHFNKAAKRGSFIARDNVGTFLDCCRKLGVPDVCCFVNSDLIATDGQSGGGAFQINRRAVVNTLWNLARIAAKNGLTRIPRLLIDQMSANGELPEEFVAKVRRFSIEERDAMPPPPPQFASPPASGRKRTPSNSPLPAPSVPVPIPRSAPVAPAAAAASAAPVPSSPVLTTALLSTSEKEALGLGFPSSPGVSSSPPSPALPSSASASSSSAAPASAPAPSSASKRGTYVPPLPPPPSSSSSASSAASAAPMLVLPSAVEAASSHTESIPAAAAAPVPPLPPPPAPPAPFFAPAPEPAKPAKADTGLSLDSVSVSSSSSSSSAAVSGPGPAASSTQMTTINELPSPPVSPSSPLPASKNFAAPVPHYTDKHVLLEGEARGGEDAGLFDCFLASPGGGCSLL